MKAITPEIEQMWQNQPSIIWNFANNCDILCWQMHESHYNQMTSAHVISYAQTTEQQGPWFQTETAQARTKK